MKWKVLCMQQTIWIIFIKNIISRTNVSNFKMVAMPCIWDQMIPWYGHQTFISTTWKVSTSGTKVSTKYQSIRASTQYQSINIRYVRNVLSLFLFKDNTFFRLLIPFKDTKLFQMITNQIKMQRSVEEDLTPEPQTKWFSCWPFVQPGSGNWSDCTFLLYFHLFIVNSLWMFKLCLHFQVICVPDFDDFPFNRHTCHVNVSHYKR